jgi:hypothetical protein
MARFTDPVTATPPGPATPPHVPHNAPTSLARLSGRAAACSRAPPPVPDYRTGPPL